MATFQYIAKDSSGGERRGTVEAADRNAAISAVRAQGLLPTALGEVKSAAPAQPARKAGKSSEKAAKPAKKGGGLNKEIKINIRMPKFLQGKIKTKVLTQFTRQLATLVNAGLPLMRGIEVLKRQMRDQQMLDALNRSPAAKPQVNPRYKAIWKSYIDHPANSSLDQQQLKDGFNNLRASIIGKEKKAADYTDDDWDKLESAIAELADDLPY